MAHKSPKAREIAAIKEPGRRLAVAQEFLTNGRVTIREVQTIRDETIRELRGAGLARKAIVDLGAPESVVVDALRRQR